MTKIPFHNHNHNHNHNHKLSLEAAKAAKVRSEEGREESALRQCISFISSESGYVLEDVPHFTDYILDLPIRLSLSLTLCWLLRNVRKKMIFLSNGSFVAKKMKGKRRKK